MLSEDEIKEIIKDLEHSFNLAKNEQEANEILSKIELLEKILNN